MAQETSTTAATVTRTSRLPFWIVGVLTILASILANLLTRFLAFALFALPQDFLPLTVGAIAISTTVGVGAAVGVYALVKRFAKNPTRTYLIVAVIALLISFIPSVQIMLNPASASFPGATVAAAWVLATFHVVAAIVSVTMLVTLSPSAKRS